MLWRKHHKNERITEKTQTISVETLKFDLKWCDDDDDDDDGRDDDDEKWS